MPPFIDEDGVEKLTPEELEAARIANADWLAEAKRETEKSKERYAAELAKARRVYESMSPEEKKELEQSLDSFNKRWELTIAPEFREQTLLEHLADRLNGLDHMADKMHCDAHTSGILANPDHPYHKIAAMDRDEFYETFPQLSPEGIEATLEAGGKAPLEALLDGSDTE